MKRILWFVAALAASSFGQAQNFYSWSSGKGGGLAGGGFSMLSVNRFKTGSTALQVTALGYEVNDTRGVGQVGLFDDQRRLLTWANVSLSTTPEDGYYWANISSFNLQPSTTYYLAGFIQIGNRYVYNTNTASLPSGVTDLGTFYSAQNWGGTIDNPEDSKQFRHYIGNMRTQIVPEPASLSAFTLMLVGLVARRKKPGA